MAELAEHSEELAELERRVEELENLIGAQKDGDSIEEAVKRIDAQLAARVTGDQRKLFELYSSHKQLVEQPLRFATSDAELAIENLDDIRAMAKQLEELDQLTDQINPAYLSSLPESQAALQPLKQIHIQQVEDQGELAAQIDGLLATYNNFVMDVSAKFVGIDAALTSKGY